MLKTKWVFTLFFFSFLKEKILILNRRRLNTHNTHWFHGRSTMFTCYYNKIMVIHLITRLNPIRRNSRKREDEKSNYTPPRRFATNSLDSTPNLLKTAWQHIRPRFVLPLCRGRSVVFLRTTETLLLSRYTFERGRFLFCFRLTLFVVFDRGYRVIRRTTRDETYENRGKLVFEKRFNHVLIMLLSSNVLKKKKKKT